MYKFIRIFLSFLLVSLIITQQASAMTIDEGKVAFQNYVKNSNACNTAFINMYDKDSVIKRIVRNKDGSGYTKIMPVSMYKMMLINYSKVALWQGYSNNYTNVSFQQCGNDVMVKALRHPSTSKDKLPATIVFHTNARGKVVVKEEIFHTNAGFLVK
ncbi:MAG: hypothetical protein PHE78_06395 [Candidatus Gastranaerophilales bacterium]|nr:hypothetical protein [Candidatus Gastranaerophilales bacterium]